MHGFDAQTQRIKKGVRHCGATPAGLKLLRTLQYRFVTLIPYRYYLHLHRDYPYDPVYLEFDWLYPVPDSLFTTLRRDFGRYEPIWFRGRANGQRWVPRMVSEQILRFKPDPLKLKPSDDALLRDQLALTKLVLDQGKCIDVGLRLIISDGGDVYFTADHYETFYRYSEDAIKDDDETGSWVPYISPEVRYQLKRNEFMLPDASWYWPERPIMHEKVWSMRNW